jgi:hypothetical protein
MRRGTILLVIIAVALSAVLGYLINQLPGIQHWPARTRVVVFLVVVAASAIVAVTIQSGASNSVKGADKPTVTGSSPVGQPTVPAPTADSDSPLTPATGQPKAPSPIYLSSLTALGGDSGVYDKESVSIDGELHPYSVTLVWGLGEQQSVEYAIPGGYTRFSAVLGIRDDAEQGDPANVCHWRILGDGDELKVGDTSRKHHLAVESLPIKGTVHLKIEVVLAKGMPQPINPAPCAMGDAKIF